MQRINCSLIMLLIVLVLISSQVEAQGSPLQATIDQSYTQQLNLEPNSKYRIAFNVRSQAINPIIGFVVELYDINDQRIGLTEVQRGLDGDEWHTITLELDTPSTLISATMEIKVDQDSEFWWDSLRITQMDQSEGGIRDFWEDKFKTYDQVYTGLVIDARGLGLSRGMSPRIWSESGQLIYGGMNVAQDYLQTIGLVSYGNELSPDLLIQIQADSSYPLAVPLVIKAMNVLEPARTNVVVSEEAAVEILQALAAYDFLARFSVIFLHD